MAKEAVSEDPPAVKRIREKVDQRRQREEERQRKEAWRREPVYEPDRTRVDMPVLEEALLEVWDRLKGARQD